MYTDLGLQLPMAGPVLWFNSSSSPAIFSIAVFILSVVTLLLGHPRNGATGPYDSLVEIGVPVTLFYASVLALSALYIQPGWSRVVTRHYNLTVLATFCVYFYRDVFPLMTFTLSIQDPAEGKLLWAKVALLGFIGVVLPLGIPRAYVPVDPNNPSPTPSPEQTSSIFSLITFFYLDPLVILAYRVPQLAFEQLPPLADFDHGHYLKRTRFPHMDVFSGAPKRHLFWGLVLAFRMEYAHLLLMIELRIVFSFASPISLNRLLAYIETRGEDAFIRPYVWILFLLFGPVLASIVFQRYFVTVAKIIVRLQALLTELVFEHSLRIRMKAAVPEAESTLDGAASAGNGDESTVQASNASTNPNTTKTKAEKEGAKKASQPDSPRNVTDARDFFLFIAYVPIQIALCILFLYTLLGWSAFVGLAILIENRLKKADARVQSVTEIMNVLRMVKLFGWETRMDERITSKRENEMIWIKYRQLLDLLNEVVNFIIPVITMIATYAVYMAVFEMLQQQLHEIFNLITTSIAGKVSVDRLNDFLKDTELIDAFAGDATTGGIAYAAQESWVQNETIKANIIFGALFDEARYKKVIYQCGLERDISLFDAGDETEVGEKGLTLSGGQKARVTLARHVMALFPRSQCAKVIVLGRSTRLQHHPAGHILALRCSYCQVDSRKMLCRRSCERRTIILVICYGWCISAQGSASDVWVNPEFEGRNYGGRASLEKGAQEIDGPADKKASGKLIVAEEMRKAMLGGLVVRVLLPWFPISYFENVQRLPTWWIGYWASQYEQKRRGGDIGPLSQYSCTGLCAHLDPSIIKLMQSILGTTLRWLDTTPTSRVIARCTQDIQAIDGPVAMWFQFLLNASMTLIVKLCAIVIVTPVFLVPSAAVAIAGILCGQVYMKAQLSVKRQMANAKAPVLAHFGAAIAGLTSIHAGFKSFHRLGPLDIPSHRLSWGIFAAALATYLVYFKDQEAGSTGFSLNLAIGFSGLIMWWVRTLNMFEVQGNSLERIQQYIQIEQEPKATNQGEPPAYWPASGDLRVENLSARYSLDGAKVLHDISFHIKSGERVGVVGRTGSGKSSLTLSLLRCIFTEGNVYYDGLSTSLVNLDALRTSITIIPQMPELLSGSLRQNLDLFDQYDDASLNDALRAAGLFSLQDETEEGRVTLDSTISSGGGNLSVGQRQIIALARAIVRGSKLLILDEATSAIDYKTDSIIQSSLRHELKGDVTLITVAHRLQTIMDADKVMVLDAGNLVEFDSPTQLLRNEKGFLRALVDESNDKATLYAMAEGRHA
ncbi:hypothetical protein BDZ89DRAFT_1123364 [Hymenopellis radicata]|nr:hypothetical protein BDZ89DRAFT_1123364 [Hymenopellis radicata]